MACSHALNNGSALGRLDAAFNNAGNMQHRVGTAGISGDEWDRVMAINLRGVWSKILLPKSFFK